MADLMMLQQFCRHRARSVTLYGDTGGQWLAILSGDWPQNQHIGYGTTPNEACAALWERWKAELADALAAQEREGRRVFNEQDSPVYELPPLPDPESFKDALAAQEGE